MSPPEEGRYQSDRLKKHLYDNFDGSYYIVPQHPDVMVNPQMTIDLDLIRQIPILMALDDAGPALSKLDEFERGAISDTDRKSVEMYRKLLADQATHLKIKEIEALLIRALQTKRDASEISFALENGIARFREIAASSSNEAIKGLVTGLAHEMEGIIRWNVKSDFNGALESLDLALDAYFEVCDYSRAGRALHVRRIVILNAAGNGIPVYKDDEKTALIESAMMHGRLTDLSHLNFSAEYVRREALTRFFYIFGAIIQSLEVRRTPVGVTIVIGNDWNDPDAEAIVREDSEAFVVDFYPDEKVTFDFVHRDARGVEK